MLLFCTTAGRTENDSLLGTTILGINQAGILTQKGQAYGGWNGLQSVTQRLHHRMLDAEAPVVCVPYG